MPSLTPKFEEVKEIQNRYTMNDKLNDLIKNSNVKLSDRINLNLKLQWAKSLNISELELKGIISLKRYQTGLYPTDSKYTFVEIKRPSILPLHKICLENDFERSSPKTEKHVCNVICSFLIRRLPIGGAAMLIGTPTPIAACSNPNTFCDTILDDNKEVAICLKWTTDERLTIVVGSGEDLEKARRKTIYWKSFTSTTNCIVKMGVVDSDNYRHLISKLAEKQKEKNSIAKVVLLTSGVWVDCETTKKKRRNRLNYNFYKPSIELVKKYDNLHIIAMTRESSFKYYAKHLHRGNIEIINQD